MNTDKPKRLFTPGPLTTSETVKQAMMQDLGSRDSRFVAVVARIRDRLLALGNAGAPEFEAVLMQGSGTFAVEAVLSSLTPADGKWLLLINGAYGRRMAAMLAAHGIPFAALTVAENEAVSPETVAAALSEDRAITHVAVVHCETTTGLMNPIEAIGAVARRFGKPLFVDAMSSFGGVPIDLHAASIDVLASSANKCIGGVPGFAFVLVRRSLLLDASNEPRTVSLDLRAQWEGFEQTGQFRFTPPVQALLAFDRALSELDAEGGVGARAARYAANRRVLAAGMQTMGFRAYLAPAIQGDIITTFLSPSDPAFEFGRFYDGLSAAGMVIYPGKLTEADTFRIGNIGYLFPADMEALLGAVGTVLRQMGVALPVNYG